jgi:serine phosphatase RsbU (regulator of sigma subunit)
MKLSFRRAMLLYTLIPIAIIFIIFATENIYNTRQEVHHRIEKHMTDLAYSYANLFNEVLHPISGIANTTADILQTYHSTKAEDIFKLLKLHVEHNPLIYGAWVIYAPYQFDQQKKLFAPYVFRQGKIIKQMDVAIDGYDYTDGSHEFWTKPVTTGMGVWTEPYFDEGAGNIMMSSYAVPFYKKGKLVGVAGIDIPLHEISERIQIPGVSEHNVMVLSETGKIILFPDVKYIGDSIFYVVEEGFNLATDKTTDQDAELVSDNKRAIKLLINSMLSGKTGKADLSELSDGADYWYFYAPIKTPGWSFAIRVHESEIFDSVYNRLWYSLLFFSCLLLFIIIAIFLVSGKFSSAFASLIDRCSRIERMNFQEAKNDKFNIEEIRHLSRTLNQMCVALNSHFSVKEDIRIAKAIRQQTLPTKMRQPPGFQFCVWSQPNKESCGETYDSVDYWQSSYAPAKELLGETAEGTAYLLLDTPDKGVDAAVKNTHLRAIFSSYAKLGVSLLDTVRYMNDYLISDLFLPGPVQAWLGIIDRKDSTLSCISLGLNAVLHYSAEKQSLCTLPNYPFALSMQKNMPELALQQIKLCTGDFIVVASDGVWGGMNENREQFGMHRLMESIVENKIADAQVILEGISQSLERFISHTSTKMDATIIVLKKVD